MAAAATELKVEAYMRSVVSTFAEAQDEALQALGLIAAGVNSPRASLGFRLLALRRYLRMGEARVVAQWAWTAEETRLQRTSGNAQTLYVLAARTQELFAQHNPGYQLSVSPLRSLEKQVMLWVTNTSVRNAGERLLSELQGLLAANEFPSTPNTGAVLRFRSALKNARVQPEPTSAAPGTSDHGQGNAVDFVVMRGRQLVAGTESSQIRSRWKGDGWEARLMAAIDRCNQEQLRNPIRPAPQLSGPLAKPYEPWHWVLKYADPNS